MIAWDCIYLSRTFTSVTAAVLLFRGRYSGYFCFEAAIGK